MDDLQININEIRNETALGGNTKTRLANVLEQLKSLNSYSTDEKLTGGTWINGKPIYRRCFGIDQFTVDMSSSFPNSFALPNSTTDVSEIITIGGFYRDCGIFDCAENLQFNTIYNQDSLDKSVFIIQNSSYSSEPIIQFINTSPTAQTLYGGSVLILEYTKTTDPIPEQ